MESSSPTFIHCSFNGNTAQTQGGAVYCSGSAAPSFIECQFTGNSTSRGNGGACSIRDARPSFSLCNFTGNTATFPGGAIYLRGGRHSVISPGNSFSNNRGCGGNDLAAWSIESNPADATGNSFTGSALSEAYVLPDGAFDISGHTSLLEPVNADLFVAPDGSNDLNSGLSPDSPFRTVRHALDVIRTGLTRDGLVIHLAPGTYSSDLTGETYPLPLLSGINLIGAGSEETVLNSGNAFGCLRCELSIECGAGDLTLTGAKGPGFYARECAVASTGLIISGFAATSYGAGIQLTAGANGSFSNSIIAGNHADVSGGGLHLATQAAGFTDCFFTQNSADCFGGAVFIQTGSATMSGCMFSGNSAQAGGAIRIEGGTPDLSGLPDEPNIFQDNRGSRGANLSADRIPQIPYYAVGNTFDVSPESVWSVAPGAAFDTTASTVTGPPFLGCETVYVSTDGDDDNDGLSPDTAFRTITFALKCIAGTPDAPASVLIAEGMYTEEPAQIASIPDRVSDSVTTGSNAAHASDTRSRQRSGEGFPLSIPPFTSISGAGVGLTRIESTEQTVLDFFFSSGSSVDNLSISSNHGPGILIESCNPILDALAVSNCRSTRNGSGMALTSADPFITNCMFENNSTTMQGGAIHCGIVSRPTILDSVFIGNSSVQIGGAIVSGYSAEVVVSECDFIGNQAVRNGGAIAAFFGTLDAGNCTFTGNRAGLTGGAVYFSEAGGDLAAGGPNSFCKNVAAVGADLAAGEILDAPVDVTGNEFCGIPTSEFYVAPGASFIVTGCSGDPGIRKDVFVAPWGSDEAAGTSVSTPFRSLRHALSRIRAIPSLQHPTVHLAPGRYNLSDGDWPYTLPLISGVTIEGASAKSVVVDAGDAGSAWCGLWSNGSGLRRVTVTGCSSSAVSCEFSSLTIDECVFADNQTSSSGAAVGASGGLLTICQSQFIRNHATGNGGAIDVRQYGSLLMTDSVFYDNSAGSQGGAVSSWLAAGRTDGCLFHGNQADAGGGWNSRQDRGVVITGSHFLANVAGSGGGLAVLDGAFDVIDCVFGENLAEPVSAISGYGGGVMFDGCSSSMMSCTVVDNTVGGFSRVAGGGIAVTGGASLVVRDTIVWGNTAPVGADLAVLWRWDPSNVDLSFSDAGDSTPESIHVSPGSACWFGNGVIFVDPLFVEFPVSWLLSSVRSGQSETSPCIDAGSELAWNASYLTPDGVEYMRSRTIESGGWPDNDILDMGAHRERLTEENP
ncbi:right-handed parallel beta-helix repeat-containing protein [bacterium]|nr:right-handed parallel beta-helix repeat-containing protein [candidate division CSSED10-310 bacterium]